MKRFFYTFALLLAALMVPATANADGYVRGDATGDGVVNMDDLTTLINYLVYGVWPSDDSHEWVDLGLSSGTLWATCNVGANSPEEFGDYFAWGETEPKDFYADWTYKWCKYIFPSYEPETIGCFIVTKYCTVSSYGYDNFVDNKTELDPEDDAAYVNWGSSWRMPTKEQFQELCEQCTWQWTTQNGMNGDLVTGPNGNTLFLPAAGLWHDDIFEDDGLNGTYWSRALHSDLQDCACFLSFGSVGCYFERNTVMPRWCGLTVRAVRVPQN